MTTSEAGLIMIDNVRVLWNDEQICRNSMLIFINKTLNIMFILDKIFHLGKSEKNYLLYVASNCTYVFCFPFLFNMA